MVAKICAVIFFILAMDVFSNEEVIGPTLHEQLDREYRNSLCCTKNMRCCSRSRPLNIKLSAVLAKCANPPFDGCKPNATENAYEDEPLTQSGVTKCYRKVLLTIKIKNSGETNMKSQFVVVDHVYDPVSSKSLKLLNPYVLKLKQEHVTQAYPLKLLDFVNSEAREQVYNKKDNNYTGCRTDAKTATCGVVKYKGKIVPYSEGFCCSCDAQKNAERQPDGGAEAQSMVMEKNEPNHVKKHKGKSRKSQVGNKTNSDCKCQGSDSAGRKKNFGYADDLTSIYRDYLNKIDRTFIPLEADKERVENIFDAFAGGLYNNNVTRILCNGKADRNKHNPLHRKEDHEKNNHVKFAGRGSLKSRGKTVESNLEAILKEASARGSLKSRGKTVESNLEEILKEASRTSMMALRDDHQKLGRKGDGKKTRRQVQSSGVQKRGGQNCADRYTPPHLNPQTYHESTHCLRFSPIWYGVYKLEKPLIGQEIIIQVFEKYETENGRTRWKDVTNGKKVRLGTFTPTYRDETPTISFNYRYTSEDAGYCLDYGKYRLLMPEATKKCDLRKYPEARGDPKEYLLVDKNKIALSGDQCDVVGVGFKAFSMQRNRCSMPRGTCLHHQPKHMWLHDQKMARLNKPGCYFLKYHGVLGNDPVQVNPSDNKTFLTLNYYGQHESVIEMEINSDFNAVFKTRAAAVITEVYIDSTSGAKTYVVVKVTNSGLLSNGFSVRIADCPFKFDERYREVRSRLVVIAPQNQHVFRLTFTSKTNAEMFYCSAEAVNARNELVAIRRIRIQKLDRCICAWYCLCACIGSRQGLKCTPMQIEHYHAAGFLGGLPVVSYVRRFTTTTNDVLTLVFYILLFFLFTLLVLGLTKALIGICYLPVGLWGLNILLDLPKPMSRYYERNLRSHSVVYDVEGWPVHPGTGERTRNIPRTVEFCTNVIFFYTYPCIILLLVCKKLCCPFYTYESGLLDSSSRNAIVCTQGCGDKFCIHTCPGKGKREHVRKALHVATEKIKRWKDMKSKKRKEVTKKPTIKVFIKKSSEKLLKEDMEISDNPYYCSSLSNSSTFIQSTKNLK